MYFLIKYLRIGQMNDNVESWDWPKHSWKVRKQPDYINFCNGDRFCKMPNFRSLRQIQIFLALKKMGIFNSFGLVLIKIGKYVHFTVKILSFKGVFGHLVSKCKNGQICISCRNRLYRKIIDRMSIKVDTYLVISVFLSNWFTIYNECIDDWWKSWNSMSRVSQHGQRGQGPFETEFVRQQ